jgi:hypothetical protein
MLVAFNKFFVGDTNCPGATVHGRRQVITMLSIPKMLASNLSIYTLQSD